MGTTFAIPVSVDSTSGALVPAAARSADHFTAGLSSPLPLPCRVHGKWESVGEISTCHYDLNLALVRLRLLGKILLAGGADTCLAYKVAVARFQRSFAEGVAGVRIVEAAFGAPRALIDAVGVVHPFDSAIRQLAGMEGPPPHALRPQRCVDGQTPTAHGSGEPLPLARRRRGVWIWCADHHRWHSVTTAPIVSWRWSGLLSTVARVFVADRSDSCDEYGARLRRYEAAWSEALQATHSMNWQQFRDWARAVDMARAPVTTLAGEALRPR